MHTLGGWGLGCPSVTAQPVQAQATKDLGSFGGRGCPTLPMATKEEVRMKGQGRGDSGPVEEMKVP